MKHLFFLLIFSTFLFSKIVSNDKTINFNLNIENNNGIIFNYNFLEIKNNINTYAPTIENIKKINKKTNITKKNKKSQKNIKVSMFSSNCNGIQYTGFVEQMIIDNLKIIKENIRILTDPFLSITKLDTYFFTYAYPGCLKETTALIVDEMKLELKKKVSKDLISETDMKYIFKTGKINVTGYTVNGISEKTAKIVNEVFRERNIVGRTLRCVLVKRGEIYKTLYDFFNYQAKLSVNVIKDMSTQCTINLKKENEEELKWSEIFDDTYTKIKDSNSTLKEVFDHLDGVMKQKKCTDTNKVNCIDNRTIIKNAETATPILLDDTKYNREITVFLNLIDTLDDVNGQIFLNTNIKEILIGKIIDKIKNKSFPIPISIEKTLRQISKSNNVNEIYLYNYLYNILIKNFEVNNSPIYSESYDVLKKIGTNYKNIDIVNNKVENRTIKNTIDFTQNLYKDNQSIFFKIRDKDILLNSENIMLLSTDTTTEKKIKGIKVNNKDTSIYIGEDTKYLGINFLYLLKENNVFTSIIENFYHNNVNKTSPTVLETIYIDKRNNTKISSEMSQYINTKISKLKTELQKPQLLNIKGVTLPYNKMEALIKKIDVLKNLTISKIVSPIYFNKRKYNNYIYSKNSDSYKNRYYLNFYLIKNYLKEYVSLIEKNDGTEIRKSKLLYFIYLFNISLNEIYLEHLYYFMGNSDDTEIKLNNLFKTINNFDDSLYTNSISTIYGVKSKSMKEYKVKGRVLEGIPDKITLGNKELSLVMGEYIDNNIKYTSYILNNPGFETLLDFNQMKKNNDKILKEKIKRYIYMIGLEAEDYKETEYNQKEIISKENKYTRIRKEKRSYENPDAKGSKKVKTDANGKVITTLVEPKKSSGK